jgi:predicted O-methyltransferase YrrM
MAASRKADPFGVLEDERAAAVLRRLHREGRWQSISARTHRLRHLSAVLGNHAVPSVAEDAALRLERPAMIDARQAAFCYLTARTLQARTIVDLGPSFGIVAIWLAALRANGGGRLVAMEMVPESAQNMRQNLVEAGLADLVEMRAADAPHALAIDPPQIDLVLNGGVPRPSIDTVRLLARRMRSGAVVLTDDAGRPGTHYRSYLSWTRDHANGFQSTFLPLKGGLEYSVRR